MNLILFNMVVATIGVVALAMTVKPIVYAYFSMMLCLVFWMINFLIYVKNFEQDKNDSVEDIWRDWK